MSITQEEANKCLKSLMRVLIVKEGDKYRPAKDTSRQDAYRALYEIQETLGTRRLVREESLLENMQGLDLALAALRTPTREMVEKMRGEWIEEDPPVEYYICSKCGECAVATADHGYQYRSKFCPHCGAPMTDKAVDIMLEKWKEVIKNE